MITEVDLKFHWFTVLFPPDNIAVYVSIECEPVIIFDWFMVSFSPYDKQFTNINDSEPVPIFAL